MTDRRDFLRKLAGAGALIATAQLPSFAEDRPEVVPSRGKRERLSLSYSTVHIGLEKPFSVLHISDSHLTAAYPHENEKKLTLNKKRTTTFGDLVSVRVSVGAFDGAVVKFLYEMTDAAGALVFRGSSEHVFLGPGRRVLRLRRSMPEFAAALDACLADKTGGA